MATTMHPSFLSAVRAGNMDSVRRLVDEDRTRLYGITIKGNNILHIAANLGNDWLITQACNDSEWDLLLRRNLKGDTILHCAAREGHDRILSLLINHQAGRQMTGMLNHCGDSALHEAARGGYANAVRWLLAVGENMASIINEDGESPLYLAAARGSVEIVEMLLECAMVEYRGHRGQTALHAAVCESYGSKRSHYFNNRFNRDGKLLLHLVAEAVTSDAPMDPLNVGEIFRCTMGYFYSRPRRQIALHAAIRRSYDIAWMLLERKPPLNQQADASQSTPIHYAVSLRDVNMVRLLLQANATVAHLLDDNGLSAIHIAASKDYTVTFAVAFTLPGGYNSDDSNHGQGMVILAKKLAFKVFLISDTIAMASSIFVTFLLIYSSSPERDLRMGVIIIALRFVQVALGGMLVAFFMDIYVVVVSQCSWLAYLICGMTISVPIIVWTLDDIIWAHWLKQKGT